MARVALPVNALVPNGSLADPTGVATVAGAGNGLQVPDISPNRRQSFPELTMFRVSNASGGSGTLTVLAGTNPPFPGAASGSLVTTVGNSATTWIGPVESGRFMQNDGSVILESSVVMTVTAFKLPRNT